MAANTSCIFLDGSDFDPSWFKGGWSDLNNATFVGGSGKVTNGSGFLAFPDNLNGSGLAISGFVPAVDKAWNINGGTIRSKVENPSNFSWWGTWMDTDTDFPTTINGMPKGLVVDFITLFPPFTKSIKGKKVIVDDVDLLFNYTGSWQEWGGKFHENPASYTVGNGEGGVYYSGGSTRSNQVGDMVQFPFTGTSVSVYGPMLLNMGTITIAFTIDNENRTSATFPPPDAADIYPNFETVPSYNFFSAPTLDAGNHILTIQIMEALDNCTFYLDFIVYTAAFDSLNAGPPSTSTSLRHSPSPTTLLSNPATSSPTFPPTKSNVGAIAGGVVGSVISLIIVIVVALYLLRRRRRQAAFNKLSADPFLVEKPVHNGPHPDSFTIWNEVSRATMMTFTPAKPSSVLDIAPPPAGAASPEPPGRSALDAQRVKELEQQVEELTGQVQQLQPPAYSTEGRLL